MIDVIMLTYNQELSIERAIVSVLEQSCSFNFQLIIMEDCSIDGTRELCIKYKDLFPNKIRLILNDHNLGLLRNYEKAFKESTSKYLAILEGDDYWTDRNKLQCQCDYLETYPSVGLVHAKFLTLTKGQFSLSNFKLANKFQGNVTNSLVAGNFICPLTVLFRRSLLCDFNFEDIITKKCQTLDYALWLHISLKTEMKFIPKVVGVYRKEAGSISIAENIEKAQRFKNSTINILRVFENKHNFPNHIVERSINMLNYDMLLKSISFNDYSEAIKISHTVSSFDFLSMVRLMFSKSKFSIRLGKFCRIFK